MFSDKNLNDIYYMWVMYVLVDTVYRFWTHAEWVMHEAKRLFKLNNGHVTVEKTGLYLVYAQVCTDFL